MTALEKENLIDHVKIRYSYELGVELEKSLADYEQLQRDVKRYFELRNLNHYPFAFGSELSLELFNLRERLEKVGKEE